MSSPKAKYFARGDRLHVQAQRIWLVLVAFVMHSTRDPEHPSTVTYGDLAEAMGYPRQAGRTLARQLGIVGTFCKDNGLPPLNCIVVNEVTGEPGDHVVLRDGKTVKEEQAEVMRRDWFAVRVPTAGTFRRVWESSGGDAEDDDE